MFMEIDSVAVPAGDWIGVLEDDKGALARLQDYCDGMVLYEHALSCGMGGERVEFGSHVKVTVRDLECYGVIKSIRLQKEII